MFNSEEYRVWREKRLREMQSARKRGGIKGTMSLAGVGGHGTAPAIGRQQPAVSAPPDQKGGARSNKPGAGVVKGTVSVYGVAGHGGHVENVGPARQQHQPVRGQHPAPPQTPRAASMAAGAPHAAGSVAKRSGVAASASLGLSADDRQEITETFTNALNAMQAL